MLIQTLSGQTELPINQYVTVGQIDDVDFRPITDIHNMCVGATGNVQVYIKPNGEIQMYSYSAGHPSIVSSVPYI